MPAREATKTQRLARLAQLLHAERPPYYVRRAELPLSLWSSFPADGWYWIPNGHNIAVYLAGAYDAAVIKLQRMIEEEEADA